MVAADFEGKDDPGTTGQNTPIVGTTPIADNEWHHAAATFDGTTFAVYLDGNLEARSTPDSTLAMTRPRVSGSER